MKTIGTHLYAKNGLKIVLGQRNLCHQIQVVVVTEYIDVLEIHNRKLNTNHDSLQDFINNGRKNTLIVVTSKVGVNLGQFIRQWSE